MEKQQDLPSEHALLGAMMIDEKILPEVFEKVLPTFFSSQANRDIFLAIEEINKRKQSPDIVLLQDELKTQKKLDSVGGVSFLAELFIVIPSAVKWEAYAEILRDKHLKRRLLEISENSIRNNGENIEDSKKEMHNFILESEGVVKVPSFQEITESTFERIQKKFDNEIVRVPTCKIIDSKMYGIERGNFMVIGARPKMGKSTFGIQIAVESAKSENRVLFVSLEMSKEEIIERIYSREARVQNFSIQTGNFSGEDFLKMQKKTEEIEKLPISILTKSQCTVQNLQNFIRSEKREHGKVDLVILDYMQIMGGEGKNQYEKISKISQDLKSLAVEEDIALISFAQFNRGEAGKTEKPSPSSFRDSGSIEQDANILCALWSPEEEDSASQDMIFDVLLSRNTPTFSQPMIFEKNFQIFHKENV